MADDGKEHGLTGRLIRRFGGESAGQDRTARLGLLQGWVSIAVNTAVFLLKLVLGLVLGSIALVADSVDSLFDMLGSAIVVYGFHWYRQPRDQKHPFGHGRVDLVAGLILAVLLIVAGIELAQGSIARILNPPDYRAPWWMILLVALTVPAKELLAKFTRGISRATDSPSMEASYWYLRFDALTSATVCLGLVLSRRGWTTVDGWIGLLIAGVVGWTGLRLVSSGIGPLLGEAPTPEEVEAVQRAAGGLEGVREAHDIILHKYGDVRLVSLHVEADARLGVMALHDLSERVEKAVEEATGCKAIVHVDPVDRGHPAYERARRFMNELVDADRRLVGFHDLRVTGESARFDLSVDLVCRLDLPESDHQPLAAALSRMIEKNLDGAGLVHVKVESSYSGEGLRDRS